MLQRTHRCTARTGVRMQTGERIRAYFDACSAGRAEGIAEHFEPEAVVYDLNHQPLRGPEETGRHYAQVRERWQGAVWSVDALVVDGLSAAIEWHMAGRKDDEPFTVYGSEHYTMTDGGRISEIRQYWIYDREAPGRGLIEYPYGTTGRGGRDGQGLERPVVEEHGLLLPGRRDVLRRERRRDRGLRGAHPPRRLPRVARRRLHLVDAVLSDTQPRRRLRHHRLLRRRQPPRDARRLRGLHAHRQRARRPRDRRPRRQPHLLAAPLVPVRTLGPRLQVPGLVRVGRREARGRAGQGHLPGRGGQHLELGRRGRQVLPAPLLRRAARPQHRQPRGPRGDPQDHGLLAPAGCLGVPGRRRPLPDRAARHRGGDRGRSARVPEGGHALHEPASRRRRDGRGGQPHPRPADGVLRGAGGQRAAPAVQLRRVRQALPLPRPGVRRSARRRARCPPDATAGTSVGELRAQPRRAQPLTPARG